MNSTHPPPGHQHPPVPPPPFQPGSGPCGLTTYEWHGFLVFVILLMFGFVIAVIVAWVNSEDISDMWLQAKHRVLVTRTEWHDELFKHVLPQSDVGTLITPGPSVDTRSRPAVNLLLAAVFPSMRHRPGP